MAKLTLADLRKMREEKQKALDMRDASNKDHFNRCLQGKGPQASLPPSTP